MRRCSGSVSTLVCSIAKLGGGTPSLVRWRQTRSVGRFALSRAGAGRALRVARARGLLSDSVIFVPDVIAALKNPAHLSTRSEVLTSPSPVPKVNGLYASFFRDVPEGVPAKNCIRQKGLTLLYVGIAPSR